MNAPATLRQRACMYVEAAGGDGEAVELADQLAVAARRALAAVAEHPGDRPAALDLLAADALITLALLRQSEAGASELGAFATRLLEAEFTPA